MLGLGFRQGFHMSELRVQFGRRLRQLRRQKDLTQEQFAEAAGISVDMLSNAMRAGQLLMWFERLNRYQSTRH